MSGYIMDLRKIVGHRPLLQVGASVIVEDEKGRVLLQKRTDNHCWGYPGGSTELDERVEDAAARELREETGLPVVMWDERRTTVEAHNILSQHNYHGKKRKDTVDAVAASLILEGYLAYRKR